MLAIFLNEIKAADVSFSEDENTDKSCNLVFSPFTKKFKTSCMKMFEKSVDHFGVQREVLPWQSWGEV